MVDALGESRVEAVVDNWFPRFLANDLDYLDVRRTLDQISSWSDWADAWSAMADRYTLLGQQAERAEHWLTAASHLRRAALTLQFAQFVLTDDVSRRAALHRRQCELYARAAPNLRPAAVRVEMPTTVGLVPGYLRLPVIGRAAGLVLLVPGLESTKEQFSTLEPYLLDRGLATLSLEGPGQGEMRCQRVFRDDDYAAAVASVSRFVQREVDLAVPVVVLGTSFGGYLALRHAREVANVVAVAEIAGPYDLDWFAHMQPVVREGFRYLVGAQSDEETERLLAGMSLRGALAALDVPVLVVHGGRDPVIPVEHAHRIAADLGPRATMQIWPDGNHSCNNLYPIVRPFVADWLRDRVEEAEQR